MATMFPPIFEILKAAPAVTALLGSPPKVYSHASVPQGVKAPYVTWTVVGGEPSLQLSAPPASDRLAVQVDCWALDGAQLDALAVAVRDALEATCHMTGVVIDEREPQTLLYRLATQFDYWLAR